MADLVTPVALAQALHTFAGYVDDLARIEFDAASTKLRLVVNYASRDRTLRPLTELLRRQIPSAELFERAGGERIDTPRGGLTRLAFRYDLLFHLKDGHKLNVRELLTREDFAGGDMLHRWGAFQDQFVAPLRDDLQALECLIRDADAGELVEPGEAIDRALAALFGDAGDDAFVPTSRSTPELTALDAAVRAADLPASPEADLLIDVAILEVELSKEKPSADRLAELARDLGSAGTAVSEAVARCTDTAAVSPAMTSAVAAPAKGAMAAPAKATAAPAKATAAPAKAAADSSAGVEKNASPEEDSMAKERRALETSRAELQAERSAFYAECEAEREALTAERHALEAQREALKAERKALDLKTKGKRSSGGSQ